MSPFLASCKENVLMLGQLSQCVIFGTKFESVCSDHPKATTFFMMTKMVTLKGKCTKDFTNPNESEQAIFDKT